MPPKDKIKNAAGKSGDSFGTPSSDQQTSLSEPEPVPVLLPPPDPFQDLRYSEANIGGQVSNPQPPVWDLVPVRVKRPAPYQSPVEVPRPFTLGLELPAVEKDEPLQAFTPATRFTRRLVAAVPKTVEASLLKAMSFRSGLQKQEHAVTIWQGRVKSVVKDTTRIAREMGRDPGGLIMNRPLPLPPLQNHQEKSHGPRSDFPNCRKVKDRYYRSDAFFWQGERLGPPGFFIEMSPTWTQRKFYKPPLSIARPQLDGVQSAFRVRDEDQMTRESLKKIAIKGKGLQPHQPSRTATRSTDDDDDDDSGCTSHAPLLDGSLDGSVDTLPRAKSLSQKPCLAVQDRVYAWDEPCSRDQVEIGFQCLEGMKAYNVLRLANTGSTSIRCCWVKLFHSDHFHKGHYRAEHFLFDFSDRILLPHDSVTLKVQFHGPYVGFWREVWHLKTQPALGPDGSDTIVVSLWARSLAIDPHKGHRRDLDLRLEALATQRTAAHYAEKLTRYLPIRDRNTILREQPTVAEFQAAPDDVELFEKRNPGFSYNGHAMCVLLNLYRVFRRWRRPTIELDLVEDLTDFSVDMYETFLEQPEQNQTEPVSSEPSTKVGEVSEEEVNSEQSKRSWKEDSDQQGKDSVVEATPLEEEKPRRRTEVDMVLEGRPDDNDDPMLRSIVVIGELHRHISNMDYTQVPGEDILKDLNEAISVMSFSQSQPRGSPFKHFVCRAALARALDDVANVACKLRSNLRLRDHKRNAPSLPRMDSASQKSDESGRRSNSSKGSSPVMNSDKRPTSRTKKSAKAASSLHQSAMSISLPQSSPPPPPEVSAPGVSDTSAEAKLLVTGSLANYRKVLETLVYHRVECLLLDLQPLMNYDGWELNPLKPKPGL